MQLDYEAERPERSSVAVRIDVASVDTRNELRDEHLRTDDWFNADLEVAEYFHLSEEEARLKAFQVAQVTTHWADRAQSLGIRGTEIDSMSSAFDHDDLALALSFG